MKKADSIIYGKIITLDTDAPVVDAMVVRDKRIVYLGIREIAETMRGEETEVLDFGTDVIYPGFMDAHTHGPMAAERLALQADLTPGESMQDYVDIMAAYIRRYPDKKFYMGAGWVKYDEPTAKMLDAVCPDKPVVLRSVDGHSLWINSAAMRFCGIDWSSVERFGTAQIHVDENGEPSGLFCEMALNEIVSHFPVTIEDLKEGLLAWQEFAFSQGITAVAEAFLDMHPVAADAYAELVREGKWKLRTYAYMGNMKAAMERPDDVGGILTEAALRYDSEYFKILGQKIILDGVVEAHTASMIDEYSDQPGYHGVQNIEDPEILRRIVASANEAGFPVHTHTIGDRAAKVMLDAYQAVETDTCNFDIRNALCHLQVIRPEDIARCGAYNVIAVVAPLWAPVSHPDFDDTLRYLGPDRAWNEYPVRSFEDVGATICFHTDYPVSSVMNVPLSVYTAVKRARPKCAPGGGAQSVLDPDESISALRALLAMTINTAYMCRQEANLGTLAIGKIANASVYTCDFINYENVEDIAKAELVATIVDGRVVYKA